jgi:hypothetical protein
VEKAAQKTRWDTDISDYFPDKWKIVKITGRSTHYRVFGCWYGGFAGSDPWRMNSGIVSVTEVGNSYIFKGDSGSEYYCKNGSYGASVYGASIISRYLLMIDAYELAEGHFESLDEMPDVMKMNLQLTSEEQKDD